MIPLPLAFTAARSIPWRAVGVAALVVAGAALWWRLDHLAAARDQALAEAAEARRVAAANAAAVEAVKRSYQLQLEAIAADRAAMERRLARVAPARRAVTGAPAEDDAPVAPVLRRALEGLRHE